MFKKNRKPAVRASLRVRISESIPTAVRARLESRDFLFHPLPAVAAGAERRSDGWHITGVQPFEVDGERFDTWGPYPTRAEAEADMRGVRRTMGRSYSYEQQRLFEEV